MSRVREEVLRAVDPDRLVQLLQRMVQIQSYSNTPGEGELARWLGGELRGRGLEVSHQQVADGRLNTVAWSRGVGAGPSLMLNGHIDTNMAGLGWTRDPLGGEVADGCIYGIGVSNMKAADAAMVEAVTAPSVPDYCTIKVAGRIAPGQTPEGAIGDIRAALIDLQREDRDLQFEAELLSDRVKRFMPAFEIATDHPFVKRLAATHREVTGQEPRVGDVAPYKFYGTDAGHLGGQGGMTGLVYAPGGKFNTMADERVELADLVAAARVYALTILDTCGVA